MMPALTSANLLAWAMQAAVIVLVGALALSATAVRLPRVRLACFRALLVACLLLPFIALRPTIGSAPAAVGPSDPRTGGRAVASAAPALSVDVTADGSSSVGSPGGARSTWLPEWAARAFVTIIGLGVLTRLGWLLAGLVGLRRLRRGATADVVGADPRVGPLPGRPQGAAPILAGRATVIDRAIDLAGATADIRTSPAVTHPVTFGVRRPVVLLPETFTSLDETEQVSVLCHELLHVRRRDWLHTVAEEIVRAVLWFHPAIWWLLAQIDLSREQVVDQEVVALTERREPYLNALVTLALTPAGPILRPASLFLGRAHLLRRVALLSREVRMSRPRVIISLVAVVAALALGGQFVVHAFPLTAAAPAALASSRATLNAQTLPLTPAIVLKTETAVTVRPAESSLSAPQNRTYAEVIQRVEPAISPRASQPGADTIIAVQVTIQPSGLLDFSGPAEMFSAVNGKQSFASRSSNADSLERLVQNAARLGNTSPYITDDARAAINALRMWTFAPTARPFTTVVGFNLARTDQSGTETQPVPIGGAIKQPMRLRSVNPIYPTEAQQKDIQGVVIIELTIDGAGIPVSAYAVRPIEELTMAAIEAALQWRFTPSAEYSRRLMTVTVNFTLDGRSMAEQTIVNGVPGGVSGGVAGGVSGAVTGGVVGGVSGGVSGGVVGGVVGVEGASFGPPRSQWASNALRVGGNIKQPTRTVNVAPIYPPEAQSAGVQGVVIIEALIGTDGKVQAAQVLRGINLLNAAAIDAVKQWEYTPTLFNGTAVPVIMVVTVNFTLE